MKRVMVFGTFDIFHKGHESFLLQARKCGDYLIAVIARDRTVKAVKGKLPKNDEKKRRKKVMDSGLADKAVLGKLGDKYTVIKKYKPGVICLGYDQAAFVDKLQENLFLYGLKNVRIRRLRAYKPKIYKSSKMV